MQNKYCFTLWQFWYVILSCGMTIHSAINNEKNSAKYFKDAVPWCGNGNLNFLWRSYCVLRYREIKGIRRALPTAHPKLWPRIVIIRNGLKLASALLPTAMEQFMQRRSSAILPSAPLANACRRARGIRQPTGWRLLRQMFGWPRAYASPPSPRPPLGRCPDADYPSELTVCTSPGWGI